VRSGQRVALVAHFCGLRRVEREVGAAVRLALENERLQAGVLAQLHHDAARRDATYAAVSAPRRDERLAVNVEDDGSERTSTMVHLADRVGAVGGSLEVDATTVRAEIPCG
jgi:hypothetical protein